MGRQAGDGFNEAIGTPGLATKVLKFLLATGELLQFTFLNEVEASDAEESTPAESTGGRRLVARDKAPPGCTDPPSR